MNAPGAPALHASAPATQAWALVRGSQNADENIPGKKRVGRYTPALPLLGSEGISLTAASEYHQISGKNGYTQG